MKLSMSLLNTVNSARARSVAQRSPPSMLFDRSVFIDGSPTSNRASARLGPLAYRSNNVGERQPVAAFASAESWGVRCTTTPTSPLAAVQLSESAARLISGCASDERFRESTRPPARNATGPVLNCSRANAATEFMVALGTMKIGPDDVLDWYMPLTPSVPEMPSPPPWCIIASISPVLSTKPNACWSFTFWHVVAGGTGTQSSDTSASE